MTPKQFSQFSLEFWDCWMSLFTLMHCRCVVRYAFRYSQTVEISLIDSIVKVIVTGECIFRSFTTIVRYRFGSFTGIQWCERIFHSLIDHTYSFILIWLTNAIKVCVLQIWTGRWFRWQLYGCMRMVWFITAEMVRNNWRQFRHWIDFNAKNSSIHFRWFEIFQKESMEFRWKNIQRRWISRLNSHVSDKL